MKDNKLYLLQLLLERYKVKSRYESAADALTIERHSYSILHFILWVIFPMTVFLLTASISIVNPGFPVAVSFAGLGVGVVGLVKAGNGASQSRTEKRLLNNKIVMNDKTVAEFDRNNIQDIIIKHTGKREKSVKIKIVGNSGDNTHFISIQGKDKGNVQEDAERIRELIISYLQLKA